MFDECNKNIYTVLIIIIIIIKNNSCISFVIEEEF